jgi:ketosteroid isomerase-like protein
LSEGLIRAARLASNAAIARRDPDAIAAFLAPEFHVVTSSGAHRHGREESRRSWIALFASDATLWYVRTPREIRVNEAQGLAHESGEWEGTTGQGIYAARWRRIGGEWLIQAELFTPLTA